MTDTTKNQKRPDEDDSQETVDEQASQEDAPAAEVQEASAAAEDAEAGAEGADEDAAVEEDAEEARDSADDAPAEGEPEPDGAETAEAVDDDEAAVEENACAPEAVGDDAETADDTEEAAEDTEAAEVESPTPAAPAAVPPQEDARPKKKRALKIVLIIVGIIVVLAAAALALLAFDDGNRVQKVPQTTMLDGKINVSGMTAEELDKTVTTRVKNGFTTKVVLNAGGEEYTIDLSEVGTLNAQQTVDQAFAPYDVPFYERYWDRITTLFGGVRHTYEITTAIAPDKEKLTAQVEQIAKKVNRDAEDASYKYSNGKLVTVKAKDGLKLDVDATVEAVTEALAEESTHVTAHVDATVKKTKAEKTKPGQAIFVDCNSCMIYLYEDGKVTFKQPCSPGRSGYETPTGDWTLSGKIANPTWTNPGSDWAKNMPETIGPGRSNPMGLRKLAVSCGDGIFIHGTDNIGALGSPDSHGCIRVSNDEIVKLYDMVSEGIPIIIR